MLVLVLVLVVIVAFLSVPWWILRFAALLIVRQRLWLGQERVRLSWCRLLGTGCAVARTGAPARGAVAVAVLVAGMRCR
ncbi:hypothetical protein BH09ACT6_BH09ACT6_00030 [soil metagenome]